VPTAPYLAAALAKRMEETTGYFSKHESRALNFVIGQMRAHASAEGLSPLTGPDVEELFSAVQMLTDREQVELSPFVRAWHPAIDSFGRENNTDLTKVVSDSLRRPHFDPVGKAVRDLIRREIKGSGGSATYQSLLASMQSRLCEVLRLPGESFAYLHPLFQIPGVQLIASAASGNLRPLDGLGLTDDFS